MCWKKRGRLAKDNKQTRAFAKSVWNGFCNSCLQSATGEGLYVLNTKPSKNSVSSGGVKLSMCTTTALAASSEIVCTLRTWTYTRSVSQVKAKQFSSGDYERYHIGDPFFFGGGGGNLNLPTKPHSKPQRTSQYNTIIVIIILNITNKMQLYRLIYYSKSPLHVAGDVFAHQQERNCIYSIW
jgi:hypothetical protein